MQVVSTTTVSLQKSSCIKSVSQILCNLLKATGFLMTNLRQAGVIYNLQSDFLLQINILSSLARVPTPSSLKEFTYLNIHDAD